MPAATATRRPPPALVPAARPSRDEDVDALAWAPTSLLVGGAWRPASAGRRLPVEDPSTGRTLCSVADAEPGDCLAALDAADGAAPGWAARPPRERSRILRRCADALRDGGERMARLLTLEMGRPLAESRAEAGFAADYLEWYAEEAVRVGGRETLAPDGGARHLVLRRPLGACLIVTPWNFPLVVPARALAPALAAGCTVVLRPSASTPLCALALARLLTEAGLPPGVLNVIVSSRDGATDALLTDARLAKLTFTGSPRVGRHLAALAAGGRARTMLELGGCAPFVVFADADLDAAVDGAVQAKMRNGGAACTAANRFYVERPVHDEFTRRLAARLRRFRAGRGTRPAATLGPMISDAHRSRLGALVVDAVARGARVVLEGGPLPGPGWFFRPVVLADVPDGARVMREEVFGPVAPVRPFDDEAEALRLANDSPHALAAYLYTRDLGRALRMAGRIEAGMVAVNRGRVSSVATPFGGIKGSGHGAAGGPEGIEEYLATSCVSLPDA
jgi:succinate-semialdehyde dehydrogenase/glutarate-semialdehyde dehydrogenase